MTGEKNIREIIISNDQVFEGDFLKVDRVTVELPDGKTGIRDIVRHPGAVAILALNEVGDILLERQYRTALDEVILEIPAGKVDPGEDRKLAAARELEEETGFIPTELDFLGDVILAAGYSDEKISLYLAKGLIKGSEKLDADEFLDWKFMPQLEVLDLIRANKIQDSKTIAAMLYLTLGSYKPARDFTEKFAGSDGQSKVE